MIKQLAVISFHSDRQKIETDVTIKTEEHDYFQTFVVLCCVVFLPRLLNPREKSNSLLMTIENNKGAMTHDGQKIETDVIIKTEEHDYF